MSLQPIPISFHDKWKILGYGDNKQTQFTLDNDTLKLTSENAVAFYYYRLPRLSQISHCDWRLSFSWRVLSASNLSSQKVTEGDDRPLAIHLWVNDPSKFGWFKGSLAKLFAIPTPGYMLTYSWGIDSEWQQRFENPHLPNRAHIHVLRKAEEIGNSWFHETIELTQEISAHFGNRVSKKKLYLVVSADTEDSNGSAISELKDIKLVPEQCEKIKK